MTVKLLVGDVRDRIREVPDGSVDLVACSPPFLALRKYGDNTAEMGSERTPADFLDALLELTQEFRRVLTPHGSIAIELGDTYSGSGGAGGDYGEGGLRDGQAKFRQGYVRNDRENRPPQMSGKVGLSGSGGRTSRADDVAAGLAPRRSRPGPEGRDAIVGWPLAKSLALIPTLYPASLAYGWNMLNPAHTFDRWRVRNIIVWARPNPPVGALGDKVRPATSYITIACTSAKRWFDLDSVRTEAQGQPNYPSNGPKADAREALGIDGNGRYAARIDANPAGAPPLDWWEDDDPTGHATLVLPTQPYPGAHYATWPEKLAARLIEMMCPLRVCTTCGEPSRRIVSAEYESHGDIDKQHQESRVTTKQAWVTDDRRREKSSSIFDPNPAGMKHGRATKHVETLGWSDCGHDTWRPGMILDPFAGSGTTLCVAQGLARDATGIELYEANADLVRQRVGMFLEVA